MRPQRFSKPGVTKLSIDLRTYQKKKIIRRSYSQTRLRLEDNHTRQSSPQAFLEHIMKKAIRERSYKTRTKLQPDPVNQWLMEISRGGWSHQRAFCLSPCFRLRIAGKTLGEHPPASCSQTPRVAHMWDTDLRDLLRGCTPMWHGAGSRGAGPQHARR